MALRLGTARAVALAGIAAAATALAVRAAVAPTDDVARAQAVRLAVDHLESLERSHTALGREIVEARLVLAERTAIQLAEDEAPNADTRLLVLIGGAWTVTASTSLAWERAAERLEGREATTWEADESIWHATRATADGTRKLARVILEPPPAPPEASAAISALTVLEEKTEPDRTPELLGLAAALAVAVFLALFHQLRFARPIVRATAALDAGLDPPLGGGRDARAITAALAQKPPRAPRDPALDPAVARLAESLAAMGRGDLAPRSIPTVPEPLTPLATAVAQAREALAARVAALHRAASTAAREAQSAHSPRALEATLQLAKVLTAVGESATSAHRSLDENRRSVAESVVSLDAVAESLRRSSRELRVKLGELTRRVAELAERADHLDTRASDSAAADEALDRLATVASVLDPLPAPGGATISAAQAVATARRGRAALAELRREVENLSTQLMEIGDALSRIAEAATVEIPPAPPGATAAIRETLALHVASAERLLEALPGLAAGLTDLASAGIATRAALERLSAGRPALDEALLGWDLGSAYDGAFAPAPGPPVEPPPIDALRDRVADAERRLSRLLDALETHRRASP